jgi:glycosyltransferase involved in cell wall biosynthesis
VTSFGFINPLKGYGTVYEALKRVRADRPDLRWTIIGPFDPSGNEGHRSMAGWADEGWVEFTGSLDGPPLRTRLAETELMLLPFNDGASPRRSSLQVAWAFGLATLTTPPPASAPEPEIRGGVNCALALAGDVDAWDREIRTLLADPGRRALLGAGAAETAARYSVASQACIYLEIYEDLLSRRGGGA